MYGTLWRVDIRRDSASIYGWMVWKVYDTGVEVPIAATVTKWGARRIVQRVLANVAVPAEEYVVHKV